MSLIKNTLTSLRDVFSRNAEPEPGGTTNPLTNYVSNDQNNISNAQPEADHNTINNNSRPDWYESTHGSNN